MEHSATHDKAMSAVPIGPDAGSVGVVDFAPRFATMVSQLADATADDAEVDDVLQSLVEDCVELPDIHAAVVTLHRDDGLHAEASSRGAQRAAEAVEINRDGPGLLAYRIGEPVTVDRLEDGRPCWPAFTDAVLKQGYRSARAIPMSASCSCIGALNLFSYEPGHADEVTRLAQTLAEIVTNGILQQQRLDEALTVSRQLQRALDSRVVIEQAKGILAERFHMSPDECFEWLRRFCRDRNRRVHDVATAIVNGERTDEYVPTSMLE